MVWDASADRPARLGAERAAHLSCNMPGYRTRVAARLKKHTLATYSDDFHPLTGQLSVPSSSNSCCPCPCPCRGTPDERPASHTRSSVCHYHHSPTQDPSERAPSRHRWHRPAAGGHRWHRAAAGGHRWHRAAAGGHRWHRPAAGGHRWHRPGHLFYSNGFPSCPTCFPVWCALRILCIHTDGVFYVFPVLCMQCSLCASLYVPRYRGT